MAKHIVKQGECFSSIADRYGFDPETLYNLGSNAELKKKRPFLNILAAGDTVEVPEPKTKIFSRETDKQHKFILKRRKVKFRVYIANSRREPYEDAPYVLTIGGQKIKGRTQSGGLIECDIPAQEQSGHLQLWWSDEDESPIVERDLAIGHLDPIDLISGIQGRLVNLGFMCNLTGEYDADTLAALRRFRLKNDLALPDPKNDSADSEDTSNSSDSTDSDDGATVEEESAESDPPSNDTDPDPEDPVAECEKLVDDALRSKLQQLYEGQ